MTSRHGFRRSRDVKEVIHIRANKFSGYFNADCKRFAIDPHVTTFADLKEILLNAFNIPMGGLFDISYLCQDDKGEDVYLSMLTEWDLDAAILTSSDPCLVLKVEIQPGVKAIPVSHNVTKREINDSKPSELFFGFGGSTSFQVPKGWSELAENAIAKITSGIGQSLSPTQEEEAFFPRNPPLGDCELHDYLDKVGRLVKPEDLRLRIYYGGVEPSQRKVVWRLLLNIFPENLTAEERISYMKRKTKEYHALYMEWKSLPSNQFVDDLKKMIWKDVLRTDRSQPYFSGSDENPHLVSLHNLLLTYALTHKNVRYCQGMSDIAAPILFVMNNEPHAYVCFCGLMQRLESNFYSDGEVMSKKFEHLSLLLQYHDIDFFEFLKALSADNMYFCYRWLLLEMKREFDFNDALMVLEVMWSSLPPQPPEKDLSLGVIMLQKTSNNDPLKRAATSQKRMSLPDLTLSVKNLPTSLRIGTSSGNLKNLENNNVSHSPHRNKISYYRENLYPTKIDTTRQFSQPQKKGYIPLQNIDICDDDEDGDSGVVMAQTTLIGYDARLPTTVKLPPPEELGCGNPFLLFVCLAVLLDQKEELMDSKIEYADLVMHLDKMVRKHSPSRVLSKAMQLFASYLRSQSMSASNS